MASLTSLDNVIFNSTNYSTAFIPDFTQPDSTIAAGGVVTIPDNGFGYFSAADDNQIDQQQVVDVDTSKATSYRLGTLVVNDISSMTPPVPCDIIAVSGDMVLLGITAPDPYDPTQAGGSFYPDGYLLLSNVDISELDGNPNPPQFPLVLQGGASQAGVYNPPCFAAGTRIATPDGDVAVEVLAVGDLVMTAGGEATAIVWTGSRQVAIHRHRAPELVRPVCVSAGAFADNVPSRDLLVSPDHNLFVGGVLIPAKCLVNGASVRQLDVARITYHHIELAEHAIVLADGMPCESYLDVGNRTSFSNEGVTVAHPDFASSPDTNYFAWEAKGCARLVLSGPEVDEARALLAERVSTGAPEAVRAA